MRVLLVEDDLTLGSAVRDHLMRQHHAADWVQTLSDADAALAAVDYGLMLLDLQLPDGSGIQFLAGRRSAGLKVPVIILTARDQVTDRIDGLNAGADDYLVKPFDLGELSARILAVSRRYEDRSPSSSILTIGDLKINKIDRQLLVCDQEVELTGREWAILDLLSSRPDKAVPKDKIEEALYAFGSEIESNTVEVYISRLRKKLGQGCIKTSRGIGYRLETR